MSNRLERIFIRAKDANGKWGNVSLMDATDEQFDRWFGSYFRTRAQMNRTEMVEQLDEWDMPPVEIKEEAFDKMQAEEVGDGDSDGQ